MPLRYRKSTLGLLKVSRTGAFVKFKILEGLPPRERGAQITPLAQRVQIRVPYKKQPPLKVSSFSNIANSIIKRSALKENQLALHIVPLVCQGL